MCDRFVKSGFLDKAGITLVNCQGKTNIPLFIPILAQFQIPFLVIFDKDSNSESDKQLNEDLRRSVDEVSKFGRQIVLNPDFEGELGVTKAQAEKYGKPKACVNRAGGLAENELAGNLKEVLHWIAA